MSAPDDIDVFISYASEDADHDVLLPHVLAKRLESEGYKVWWDLHLQIGDAQKQLMAKVARARYVIALWSPRTDKSRNVYFECEPAAIADKLLPIVIEGDCYQLPPEWRHLHWLKLTDFEKQKPEILRKLPKPSHAKPPVAPAQDATRISIPTELSATGLLLGRDAEKAMLSNAWTSTALGADPAQKTNIAVLHAIGGAGKTALMRHFLNNLADLGFAGADKVFGWSAHSQGSGDNRTANADAFLAEALGFFGYTGPVIPDVVERGRTLAALVASQRALLILDGLEPLQDLPHVNGGRLKDRGLAALITSFAVRNDGLLLITSRQALPELEAHHNPRVICHPLDRLDQESGVKLLSALGVTGKRSEMEHAVEEVLGHALSLNLLGTYLSSVHGGDVNQREQFHLGEIEDADADFVGDATARYAKRAARIMEGAIARLGEAETAILHIVGLFDRPAEFEALEGLLAEPAIPGLTDAFHALGAAQRKARWNIGVERLRKLKLLAGEDRHQPGGLDAHPIVRAHFGDRLKVRAPEAFREAHSRLYDFYRYQGLPQAFRAPEAYGVLALRASYPEHWDMLWGGLLDGSLADGYREQMPPSIGWLKPSQLQDAATLVGTAAFDSALTQFLPGDLEAMRPCFSAIAHGCAAGRHQEAYSEVYLPRVLRGLGEAFLVKKIGVLSANLAAIGSFFDKAWHAPVRGLSESDKARILNFAGYALMALGRLSEAAEPFEAGLKANVAASDWQNAAIDARRISELRLSFGDVAEAILAAKASFVHADTSGEAFQRMENRAMLADALLQAGRACEAQALFEEAEVIQAERQPALPKRHLAGGYRYCDLLLVRGQPQAAIERATSNLSSINESGQGSILLKTVR